KKQASALAQRKSEQVKQQQKQKTRRIIWFSTVGVLLALCIIVLLIPTKPSDNSDAFNYVGLPVLGDPNAPIKIVEFGDYKCPACSVFNELIKPQIQSEYIDQGKVAFYFMNYPFLGTDSDTAALAAQAVYHQSNEAFWSY